MFNDILGTTLGTEGAQGYVPMEMTAFGDRGASSGVAGTLLTGKPEVRLEKEICGMRLSQAISRTLLYVSCISFPLMGIAGMSRSAGYATRLYWQHPRSSNVILTDLR